MLNFCPKCGNSLQGDRFCPNCGADLINYLSSNDTSPKAEHQEVSFSDLAKLAHAEAQKKMEEDNRKAQTEKDFFIYDNELQGYTGYGGDVVVPDCVKFIRSDAFSGNDNITSVTINENVPVDESAFKKCKNLRRVIVNTSVSKSMFSDCSNLTSVVLGNRCTTIGDYAFYECRSLREIQMPRELKEIGRCAFSGCNNLKEIIIPDGVRAIGDDVFDECTSLKSLFFPDSVISIGDHAFLLCKNLQTVSVSRNTIIGQGTLQDIQRLGINIIKR